MQLLCVRLLNTMNIFLYFFIWNAGNWLISTTLEMTLKIYYLHLRDREKKRNSQTHFSDRILNYVLMSDCFGLCFRQLTQFLILDLNTLRKANAQRILGFFLFLIFFSLVNFKIFLLLSTTVFLLFECSTVYFFEFSHQRAHFDALSTTYSSLCLLFTECFTMHWNCTQL